MTIDARPPSPPAGAGSGRATIKDVARVAGVSVATVSKVINDRYGVAPRTFERVMEVVAELGYESSLVAASLRRRSTNVIGILVAEFEPYSTELLKGISSAVAGTGYEVLAYAGGLTDDPVGWERRSLSRLAGTLIDGAVIVTPTVEVTSASIPVVAIDPHTGPDSPTTIDSDNQGGARVATEYLISLGHRRVAHLRGRTDLRSAHLRELGYREALDAAGIAYDDDLVRDGGYSASVAATGARELLTLPEPPTALFAANDLSAIAAVEVAHELGIDVPGELSVVGFDDIPEAVRCTPALTTIAQPLQQMGVEAVRMLLGLLGGAEAPNHLRLPARLIVRDSTEPARG